MKLEEGVALPIIPTTIEGALATFDCTILRCTLSGKSCLARFRAARKLESKQTFFGEEDKQRRLIPGFGNQFSSCIGCPSGAARDTLLDGQHPQLDKKADYQDLNQRKRTIAKARAEEYQERPPRAPLASTRAGHHITKEYAKSLDAEPKHIDLLILRALQVRGPMSRGELATLLSRENTYIKIKLYRMGDRGLIEVVGKGRASKVVLAECGTDLLRKYNARQATPTNRGEVACDPDYGDE